MFDSSGQATGQDYSRWNDVWLTLRGQYGARSTRSDPHDETSSVMYIAAPVMDKGRIIGVLSVGKPNLAMTPVIKRSERRILWARRRPAGHCVVDWRRRRLVDQFLYRQAGALCGLR